MGQIKNIKLHIVTDIKVVSNNIEAATMEEDWGMPDEGGAELVDSTPIEDIKLFGKWNPDEVQVSDISLTDYIAVKEKNAVYLPHTAARYAQKRFRKAQCPIVERLVNALMMHGRNNGKKLMAVRIARHAFEIIHLLTGENPLQVLVDAIITARHVKTAHASVVQEPFVVKQSMWPPCVV